MSARLPVRKTYKLFIGGSFVRSESGRYDRTEGGTGAAAPSAGVAAAAVNVPRASRKDVRDAVAAARSASGPWASRTAYNRGQILYRFAEALESRAAEIGTERSEVEAAIDVLVHYAGWTDKLQPVLGGINPVAAPFLSFSVPEPTGVVGIVAPDAPPLLGLVAELAPALAAGNTAVCVLSEELPLPGLDLGEVLGIADVPGGVVNLLSGRRAELAPALAAHHALNAIVDATAAPALAAEIDRLAAESVTRVRHTPPATSYATATADPLSRLEAVTELKTAWHPVGA
ncbi:MAG TPA: aldehyde dehydrogenase family protein [Thermoleophilaceae bacterium]|jgi:acyl-CoA reductase-like NAD-dependent aldehyde dehydrogenase|nr:aldehyde dehydrogenase family protein [Thermoleophilaceae bacterium]